MQSEVEALEAAAPNNDILDIPLFDAVVVYGNKPPFRTDLVKGIKLGELPKGMGQGDKNMEVTIPFINMKNEYNV